MAILVTGAAGFVGSHFARSAHDAGLAVVAMDDLSTSRDWPRLPDGIERVLGDVGDRFLIEHLVKDRSIDTVVHFAGRIQVGESMREPALYFEQNLARATSLIDAASSACKRPLKLVLSSSAAVYGQVERSPIVEIAPTRPINPYGASKLASEIVLESYARARGVRWAALRYFNAAGAHPDGSLRERHDPETHLIPLAIDAALGARPPLVVYGDDYVTRDGTCVRDYVHVMDLAEAHLAAISALGRDVAVGAVNLGSERGSTVKEILAEVSHAAGRRVPYEVGSRRAGDPAKLVASAGLAVEKFGWRPKRAITEIVTDALRARRV
jgi:UDP-glucose-4-epimerase GalE